MSKKEATVWIVAFVFSVVLSIRFVMSLPTDQNVEEVIAERLGVSVEEFMQITPEDFEDFKQWKEQNENNPKSLGEELK